MNNQETLKRFGEIFKSLDKNQFAETAIRFFGEGGGTQILAQNVDCLMGMSEAALDKAVADIEAREVSLEKLPVSIAVLGVAAGVTLGVYLVAETFGLTEQMLTEASITKEEALQRLDQGRQKYENQEKIKADFEKIFKSDPTMN